MNFICPTFRLLLFFFLINFICFPVESKESQPFNVSISPFTSDFPLPPDIIEQGLSQIQFDEKGFLYLTSSSDLWIYDGIIWHQVYAGPDPKVTILGNGTKLILSSDVLYELALSPHNHFQLRKSDIHLPANAKIINVYSISDKLLFWSKTDLFSIENGNFQHIHSFSKETDVFPSDSQLLLMDGNGLKLYNPGSGFKTVDSIINKPDWIRQISKGFVLITENGRKLGIWDSEFKTEGLEVYPGKKILDILEYKEDKLLILCEDNTLLSFDLQTGTTRNSGINLPGDSFYRLELSNTGRVWAIGESSIKILDIKSGIQKMSLSPGITPEDIEVIGSQLYFLYQNTVFDASGSVIFHSAENIRDIFSTGERLFALTGSRLIRIFPDISDGDINSSSLNHLVGEDSGYFLFSSADSIFVFRYTDDGKWEPLLSTQKNEGDFWICSSRLCKVSNGVLELISLETEQKEFFNIPGVFSREFPVKLTGTGDLLWLYNSSHIYSYNLSENRYRKEDILFSDDLRVEKLHIPGPGYVLLKFRSYREPGSFLLINTREETHHYFNIPGLPAYFNKYHVKDYDDHYFLLGSGKELFLIRKENIERVRPAFYPVFYQFITEKDTLLYGVSPDFRAPSTEEQPYIIPHSNGAISLRFSDTDFLYPISFYQYKLYLEEDWTQWKEGNLLKLENLRPDDYHLSVRVMNSNGEISNERSLDFSISRPLLLKWPVILLLLLGLFVLGFITYKRFLLVSLRVKSDEADVKAYHREDAGIEKSYDTGSPEVVRRRERETRWDKYDMVTVLFSDIQGFTKIAEQMNPESLIDELDRFFFHFDSVVEKYNIEKIKTIGDAYMAAGGIPVKNRSNPIDVILAALEMQQYMNDLQTTKIDFWDLRIGIHTGPVIAGVIGHKKRSYDIWGDTVNTASRMESSGEAGRVNISGETYALVKEYFLCEYRGKLPVKYKGNLDMYFVLGLRPELSINLAGIPNRKFFLKIQLLRLLDLEDHVFGRLREETPASYHFHNPEYAHHLFRYSELLAKAENLDLEETLLVKTAVLLLMIGFIENYQSPEISASKLAMDILKEFQFSERQIQNISNLILASKCPPEPGTLLEKVMVDIRFEYLGRADFIVLYKKLYYENQAYNERLDPDTWKEEQVKLLNSHRFYTSGARRLSEISFYKQVQRINEDIWE
jgi:class 3 adenylate cyclase